jgi:hypothetical protein
MGVVACRNEDDLGFEFVESGKHLVISAQKVVIISAAFQGYVEGEPQPGSTTFLFGSPAAGKKGITMGGGEEYVISCVEGILRAVSVMNVEIDYAYPADAPIFYEMLRSYCYIIEDAKALGISFFGMMTGGA